MGHFFQRPDQSLLCFEFCAARHTLLDVGSEGCHAETLLAVNEEVEFLRGQMTVIHDCLRWVVRAGVGEGFMPLAGMRANGQTGKRARGDVSACPPARLPACPSNFLFTRASQCFAQLVPRPVDVGLNSS